VISTRYIIIAAEISVITVLHFYCGEPVILNIGFERT
jgi:hypothetical protein